MKHKDNVEEVKLYAAKQNMDLSQKGVRMRESKPEPVHCSNGRLLLEIGPVSPEAKVKRGGPKTGKHTH